LQDWEINIGKESNLCDHTLAAEACNQKGSSGAGGR